eukprot:symbB.v1.2.018165.t1/scaffold1437.1/size118820/8
MAFVAKRFGRVA